MPKDVKFLGLLYLCMYDAMGRWVSNISFSHFHTRLSLQISGLPTFINILKGLKI